ncbi:MAG: large subunit ribosomal protein L18 [Saprospiraceae bacterium]|jgi:large subunit ribosomal protein L18|tara:strand:+ start:100 stop:444 length:345 start_codon:yes stop_codon:yes gene_type:complete
MISKLESRRRIQKRIRKKVSGVSTKPRLAVFRSNKAISCQLIDDINGVTLASASSKEVKSGGNKSEISKQVGALIANKAKAIGVDAAKFDRGGNLYHGRVRSLADGAREAGLNF